MSYVWFVASHAHNVAFQKSDLFFICMLRPVSSEIKIDETEIQAAKVHIFELNLPIKITHFQILSTTLRASIWISDICKQNY